MQKKDKPNFVKRPLKDIDKDENVTITDLKKKMRMTHLEKNAYDISQHRRIKGNKSARKMKNGKMTKGKKHKENPYKYRSIGSVIDSLKWLSDLIYLNFEGGFNEYHIVVTYRKPNRSFAQTEAHITNLIKAVRKNVDENIEIKWVAKIEAHEKNLGWHVHFLIKFVTEKFIDARAIFEKCWSYGNVNSKEIYDIEKDLINYLCDLHKPNDEYLKYKQKYEAGLIPENKKYIGFKKYELSLKYPAKKDIYKRSRKNLIEPAKMHGKKGEYDELVKDKSMIEGTSLDIVKDGEVLNTYTKIEHK